MKKYLSQVAGIGLATTMALAIQSPAQAFDFTFSFDNVDGNTAGTVSGTITGLEDNTSNQAADSILITNVPPGIVVEEQDATLWDDIQVNSFEVSNGQIIAASFGAEDTVNGDVMCLGSDTLRCSGSPFQLLWNTNTNNFVRNNGAIGAANGVEFTATAVPFGVSGDLSMLILGGLYGASRLRKKLAANK